MTDKALQELSIAIVQQAHEDYLVWSTSQNIKNKYELEKLKDDMTRPPLQLIFGDIDIQVIFDVWEREVQAIKDNKTTFSKLKVEHRGAEYGI